MIYLYGLLMGFSRSCLLLSPCTLCLVVGVRVPVDIDLWENAKEEPPPTSHIEQLHEQEQSYGAGTWGDYWVDLIRELSREYFQLSFEIFPHRKHPVPYTEKKVDACNIIQCDLIREGVGRRGAVWPWLIASTLPVIVVFSHVVGTSFMFPTSRTSGKLEINTQRAFGAMFVSLFFGICIGHYTYEEFDANYHWGWIGVSLLLMTFSNSVVFGTVCVEFDWPDHSASPFLLGVSLLLVWLCYIAKAILWFARHFIRSSIYYHLFYFIILVLGGMLPPNFVMLFWLVVSIKMYVYSFYVWGDTTGIALAGFSATNYPIVFLVSVFMALYPFVPYSRDRLFVAAFGYFLSNAIRMGQCLRSRDLTLREGDRIVMLAIFAGLCCILMRYQIVLPKQLQKAKYIRLGYLYKMQSEGRKIRRCQEMPESAFGNPSKAQHLIIISHRWLDRYACDVATAKCPHGLRLTTMCRRFEAFFPWRWPGWSRFLSVAAVKSSLYSSHDVLVFFDFMSLPQIGKNPDGSLIERTEHEKTLFAEVLPAMGGLYTMFPVMVCPEVAEGSIPYVESGWCFCEWEQASVHDKLQEYFLGVEDDDENDCFFASMRSSATGRLHESLKSDEAMEEFETRLQKKKFFFDSDRNVVRSIVKGTRIRRLLLDAVIEQDVNKVKAHLILLKDAGLEETIDFAIDHKTMDTLLHMAMKFRSREIADVLVAFGADVKHPNQRGETPGQFFIFPRRFLLH